MWPLVMGFMRTYAVYITWPVAAVVGYVGYKTERYMRGDKETPWKEKGIKEERIERIIREDIGKDAADVDSLKSKKDVPQTVLNRNNRL